MKLKKVLSGFLSAAILATTTAIVMPLEVSAAETEDLDTGSLGSDVLSEDQYNPGNIAKPTLTLDNKWGNAKAIAGYDSVEVEYTCNAVDEIANVYVVAQNGTVKWLQEAKAPQASGKLTLDLSSAQDKTYEALVFMVEPASTYSTGDTFDPKIAVTSAKLIGSDGASSDTRTNFTAAYDGKPVTLTKAANGDATGTIVFAIDDITYGTSTIGDLKGKYKKLSLTGLNYEGDSRDFGTSNFGAGLYIQTSDGGWSQDGYTSLGQTVTRTTDDIKNWDNTAIDDSAVISGIGVQVYINDAGKDLAAYKALSTGDTIVLNPAAATTHKVTVSAATNGEVKADKATAEKGAKITLTVTPATGYELDTLTVTPKTEGAATVTVAADNTFTMPDDDVTVTATFKKKAVPATGVKIATPSTTTLVAGGDTLTLSAALVPEDTTDTTAIKWTSSDTTVATVDETTGVVTPVKASATPVTITATAGTFTDTVEITVSDKKVPATSVTLSKDTLELEVEKSETLTATVAPEGCTDKVVWSSDKETIAKVDQTGKVTAVAPGTATITVTAGDKTDTCTVTVTKKVIAITGVTLDKTTATVEEGKTVTLTPTVTPADTTEDKTVTWKSSDETVATVKDGVVTAVKAGTANITATAGGKTATCAVTVTAKADDTKPSEPATGINATISDLKIVLAENAPWNWQALEEFAVAGLKATKVSDVKQTVTVKFTVADCDVDASNISYQLNIMCTDGTDWPWLVAGDFTYDAKTGEVTVTADFTDIDAKYDNFEFKSFRLVAMAETSVSTKPINLTIGAKQEEPVDKSDYETGKAETVKDYVPKETPAAGTKTELKVNSISTADAAKYSSYDITITVTLKDGTKKTATKSVSDCYKGFTYSNGTDNTTVKAAEGFFILVKVKNVPADATVEMSIKGVE